MSSDQQAPARPLVSARGVGKRYANGVVALQAASIDIHAGEIVAIIGPSGSGKSTLLRSFNGLEAISAGELQVDGIDLHRPGADLRTLRTRVGMVFQQFNLFPHLTALDNLMLAPCKVLGLSKQDAAQRGQALLARVGLADKAGSYPAQLSGGQQQRVAIARALAMQPHLLLFDEPTSALDPEMVGEVLDVIRQLARDGMTLCIVTHEMAFARAVASRVLFMDGGQVVCEDTPAAFFDTPRHERLRSFLSQML